ncbi:Fic family protein [Oleomonas cavernae]|uniref:Fic family protein n=1 Tax=Oleomonas cavernae TaxID=2320859 RepID=UPI0026995D5E
MPTWNWQQADWPHFTYDAAALAPLEQQFLRLTGEFVGVFRHLRADDRDSLKIDLISDEALQTSAIEGEFLNRDSLQASLRQQFGLDAEARRILPAERGIAEMMVDVYRHFAAPLGHATLHAWHGMVMAGHRGIEVVGQYRKHAEPMQVVSGSVSAPTVHFQAPPSARVAAEMDGFIAWFNDTAPESQAPCRRLPAPASPISISRASIPSRTAMAASAAPSLKRCWRRRWARPA